MRNFDNWNIYKDTNGNPLHGCVQFNVKGGTTQAAIYDGNGVALANPQLTDAMGRTAHQVFVDSDVVAYFYKYIGEGSFGNVEEVSIDTSDLSKWALQYTVESSLSVTANLISNAATGVSSMISLRYLEPLEVPAVDGAIIVCLHGYYEPGDKAPVWYVWDSSATAADDNGSCIKSIYHLTGRWILVPPEAYCDSRHFGAFPQDTPLADVDHTTRITQLINYCNTVGIKPLFNGSVSHPYFIYSFLNVNSRNPIAVSRGTMFKDEQASNFYGDWEGDPRFTNGLTKVSAKTVKASWNFSDAITYETVYLDDVCQKTKFKNARVIVTVDTSNKVFDHCELVSDGHLGENTFKDCVLRGSMFVGGSISPTIDDQCTIQPLDFVGRMPLWCVLRSQKHDPIVDMCMQTLDASCSITLTGIWFKNALFDSFAYTAGVSVGFESCRGSLEITYADNTVVTCEDSELNIGNVSTGEVGVGFQPVFSIIGGSVNFVNTLTYLMGLVIRDTSFQGPGVLVNGDAALNNVAINMPLTVRGALSLTNCQISTEILHYTVNPIANVKMISCVLNNYYRLVPAVAGTTVNAVWSDNYSPIDAPILIDRTNIDPIDSHHTYTYSGNSGGFLPYETSVEMHECIIHHATMIGDQTPPTEPYHLTQNVLGGSDSDTNGRPNGFIMPWYSQPLFDRIRMFRIGTDRFLVRAKLAVWPPSLESAGTTNEYQHCRYHDAQLGAYFIDGYTFGVMPYWDDPTVTPPVDLRSTQANASFFHGSLSFSLNNMPSFSDYTVNLGIQYECLDRHD